MTQEQMDKLTELISKLDRSKHNDWKEKVVIGLIPMLVGALVYTIVNFTRFNDYITATKDLEVKLETKLERKINSKVDRDRFDQTLKHIDHNFSLLSKDEVFLIKIYDNR